jgi:hypothetical protein
MFWPNSSSGANADVSVKAAEVWSAGKIQYLWTFLNECTSTMRESTLLKLLRALRPDELSELQSALRKRNPAAGALLRAFGKYLPELEPRSISEEALFRQAFPGKGYSQQALNNGKSQLKKEIEQFLVEQALARRPVVAQRLLAETLVLRHHQAAAEEIGKQFGKCLDETEHSFERYFEAFHYHIIQQYYLGKPANNAAPDDMLQAKTQLDKGYLAWQLFFLLESMNRSHYRAESAPPCPIPVEEGYWRSLIQPDEPLLWLFYQCCQLYRAPQQAGLFDAIFAQLKKSASLLGELERFMLARYLANFCAWRLRAGELQYKHALMALYRWGEAEKVFVYQSFISHSTFINIAVTASMTENLEFARQFIDSHEAYLPSTLRADTLCLSRAYLFFYLKDYPEARRELEAIRQKEHYDFGMRRQSLLLRTLYCEYLNEGIDFAMLEDRCRAYRVFFGRNNHQYSDELKNIYLRLEYFIKKMADCLNLLRQAKDCSPQALLEELPQRPCIARDWVEEQIARLNGKQQ